MYPGEADIANRSFSVFLKSDAEDSDGKNGSAIKAPYGISLETFDNDTFSVSGCTVESVKHGERSGEYIITVLEEISAGEHYEITVDRDASDILGAGINRDNSSCVIGPEKFEVTNVSLEGNTVKADYMNTTENDKSFVLLIASYEGEKLSEVQALRVVANSGDYEKQAEVSLFEDTENKTVKYFVWDSFENLMPIYEAN